MNPLTEKAKEVVQSVLPIVLLVLFMHFTFVPLGSDLLIRFLMGSLFVIIGLTLFLIGVDLSIAPIAEYLGKGIVRNKKIWLALVISLSLGFFISSAEPSIGVLANQIEAVTNGAMSSTTILVVVAAGVAFTLTIGVLRILFNISIVPILYGIFGTIFVLSYFASTEFFSIAFDASGATTGALAVPFFLAFSTGIASLVKGSQESEDASFGMVAIASSGAILSVLALDVFASTGSVSGSLPETAAVEGSLVSVYWSEMINQSSDIFMAILPIVVIFGIFNFFSLKLSVNRIRRISFGLIYVFIGLIIFLTGVNAGFMEVGSVLGIELVSSGNKLLLVGFSFLLGVVTILAEPAVSVLVQQVKDVTGGAIKRPLILSSLSLGVGLAISLSVIKILLPQIELWHLIIPGYVFSLGLSLIIPKVFVGMAFDAGSVASGPIAATFILAFIQGIAQQVETADLIRDGFGMIAMVAMMPIII